MKPRALAVVLATLFVAACGDGKQSGPNGSSAVGEPAPQFQAKGLDGAYVQLTDYEGKVVLLNVWATWCTPCVKELPELVELSHEWADEGVVVLGVSVDKPSDLAAVRRMVARFGIDYPIALDPNGRGLREWGIKGYPTSFVIDGKGNIRWRRDGIIVENDGELAAQLKAAIE